MSFRCDFCDKAQPNGTSTITVVVKTRNVTYPTTREGKTPIGTEIVQEVDLCAVCAK